MKKPQDFVRYKNLFKIAESEKNIYIVTAHHSNDYLESILINFIRGGGPNSLTTLPLWQKKITTFYLDPYYY